MNEAALDLFARNPLPRGEILDECLVLFHGKKGRKIKSKPYSFLSWEIDFFSNTVLVAYFSFFYSCHL